MMSFETFRSVDEFKADFSEKALLLRPLREAPYFVRGPIEFDWLAKAGRLGGSALALGLVIWFHSGLYQRRSEIKLQGKFEKQMGLNRYRVYRGLKALEGAGLISLLKKPGSKPFITIENAHVFRRKNG